MMQHRLQVHATNALTAPRESSASFADAEATNLLHYSRIALHHPSLYSHLGLRMHSIEVDTEI